MPLHLIQEDERFEYKGEGFTIYYRRIPGSKRAEILKKHTRRQGAVDIGDATLEMMKWCIRGWDGVNMAGEPVEFKTGLVERIPDDILGEIAERAGANAEGEGADIKNSSPTSGNSTTTKE